MALPITSGTAGFTPEITEIVEEAFERCGSELRTGYDLRTAQRSLNLLFAEFANKGLNMWSFEQNVIPLVQGQSTYALPSDTVDVLEHVIRTNANQTNNQSDLTISRISVSTYQTLPNKLQQARPIQVWVQRLNAQNSPTTITVSSAVGLTDNTITLSSTVGLPASGFLLIDTETVFYQFITGNTLNTVARGQNNTTVATHAIGASVTWQQLPAITLWPVPDGATPYVFSYIRLRRTQDAGVGYNVTDIPFRFLNALIAGLAYHLCIKLPPTADAQMRIPLLKQQYDEAWELAIEEDREKAPVRFVPRQQFIGRSF